MGNNVGNKAIILLSGGLDSATVTAIAAKRGFEIYALSFDYGQKHKKELEKAALIAKKHNAKKHIIAKCDMTIFGGSALTADIEIPKNKKETEIGLNIPITYVPARNTVFLSLALAWAETLCCYDLFIGVNAVDFSGYPDCRAEYIESYENMANIAMSITQESEHRLKIHTPLIKMSKGEIIKTGLELGVDYSDTITCYDYTPEGSCGECEACMLRLSGFRQAGITDPIKYRNVQR